MPEVYKFEQRKPATTAGFLSLGAVVEDVRTVFQRLDDTTIYIPDLKPCN